MSNDKYIKLLEDTLQKMLVNPSSVIKNLEEEIKELQDRIVLIRKVIRKVKKEEKNEQDDHNGGASGDQVNQEQDREEA